MFSNALTERLAGFVREIGIDVRPAELPDGTFLPGLDIRDGAILVDESRLAHPGDILHEAGHLAVTDASERHAPTLAPADGDEMAALAWSYAALKHLALDPAVVFHPQGYKGGGASLIEAFEGPGGPGLPRLYPQDWHNSVIG